MAKLEEFIRNKLITIYSSRFAEELKTFIWHNGRAQAQRSCNDDLVMALAMGCWVRDTALTVNLKETEYKKALLGAMYKRGTTLNTSIPGMVGYTPEMRLDDKKREAKKQVENFMWLYKG